MKPRILLGLSLGLSLTRALPVAADDASLPPLEGGPSSGSLSAQAPAETPAAVAPAPSEPPPPVYEAESDFPEAETRAVAPGEGDELSGDTTAPAAQKSPKEEQGRRRWELSLGLGGGDAAGRHDWPTHGAVTLSLAGGYRLTPHFSVGLEAAGWGYTPDDHAARDVDVSSGYLAPFARYYFLDRGKLDPYVMAGFGLSAFTVEAKDDDTIPQRVRSRGFALPVGVGVDWQLGKVFRLGPQALVYWHHSTELCRTLRQGDEDECQDTGESGNDFDADALPWRVTINGTFSFGAR